MDLAGTADRPAPPRGDGGALRKPWRQGVIAVPDRDTADWAMRELVVLHEMAHHLDDGGGPSHGPGFVATFCDLATVVMGAEVGHVLRVVYAKEGVR